MCRFGKLVLAGLLAGVASSAVQSPSPAPGSIQWYVEKAKQKGDTAITVPAPLGIHAWIKSLDQALSTYQVAVAIPIASATESVECYHIYTWYKLRIVEELISHPNPDVPAESIPKSVSPAKASEVVVRIPGGSLTVDGIKVTFVDHDEHLLTLNEKYLFFLSPDSSGRSAIFRCGSDSVFPIHSGNKIATPLENRTPMQNDLDSATGGSLDALREFASRKVADRAAKQ